MNGRIGSAPPREMFTAAWLHTRGDVGGVCVWFILCLERAEGRLHAGPPLPLRAAESYMRIPCIHIYKDIHTYR